MSKNELIIEASSLRSGTSKWLMRLSVEEHSILRDKLWRILTEEDYVLSSGSHNGFFIQFGDVRYKVLFTSRLSVVPIVTIVKIEEVN